MKGRIQRKTNFGDIGWISNYTRPPKKKENQKIRIGGAHGSIAKGGFKGLKTWNISCQASRIKGVESKGRAGAFCEYMERKEECVLAYGDEAKIAKDKYKEIEQNLRQKNGVIQRRFVIPLPKEILNNPAKLEKFFRTIESKYFAASYCFSASLHKGDEKNPHVHIQYSNVDANFKAIREYQDPNMLREIKKDIKNFIENELKIQCKLKGVGKSIKHYQKWIAGAYQRAEADKSGKLMREYSERYPAFAEYVSERRRKVYERVISIKENKIKNVAKKEVEAVNTMTEKMVKKSNSWLYSKVEKEELKKDIEVNKEYVSYVATSTGNLNFSEELRQKEEREERERIQKEKEEQTKKEQELKKDIIVNNNEQKQENQGVGRNKNKEMQLDAYEEDLQKRLKKSKVLGRGF